MNRSKMLFVIILSLMLLICGCSTEARSAEELLCGICASLSMPAGQVYLAGAEEGSDNFLSSETARAIYGAEAETALALVKDYAIYLAASGSPREAAVFRCYSSSDTDTVAALLLERVDAIKILLKDSGTADLAAGAQVTVRGRYVVMVVCGDAEAAKDAVTAGFR